MGRGVVLSAVLVLTSCALGARRDSRGGGDDVAPSNNTPDDIFSLGMDDAGVDPNRNPDPDPNPDPNPNPNPDPDPDPTTCTPTVGNLVITELVIASRTGSGDVGEWFELHNPTTCDVDLSGLEIVSPTSGGNERSATVTVATVDAGEYAVFALSADVSKNTTVVPDHVYGTGGFDDVVLNNGNDWLEIRYGGAAVDRVEWQSGTFTYGASWAFPPGTDSTANDTWSNGCPGTTNFATSGDPILGSPGAANAACP